MQCVQERMGAFTPRRLQISDHFLPAFLMSIYILLNSSEPTVKWMQCIFPLYNLSKVHEQHIFLISRVLHILLGEWYMEGTRNSTAVVVSLCVLMYWVCLWNLSCTSAAAKFLRRHFPGLSFEENMIAQLLWSCAWYRMTGQKGPESTLQEVWLDSCISEHVALPAPALVSPGLFTHSLPDKISGKKKLFEWVWQ